MERFNVAILIFLFGIESVYSQLQVDSTGYVGVGVTEEILEDEEADSIMSPFVVCSAGMEDANAYFRNTSRMYSVFVESHKSRSGDVVGTQSFCYANHGNSQGIIGIAMANGFGTNPTTVGVRGTAQGGNNAVGVYGGSYIFDASSNNFAGVYGSTSSSLPSFQRLGVYAGYFNGKVCITDTLFVQSTHTPAISSNGNNNNRNISVNLIDETEHVTDKLRNVSSLELQHEAPVEKQRQTSPVETFLNGRDYQDLTRKERLQLDSICSTISPAEKDPLSSVNYGLDAEQLKAMFPKLVQQDKEGNYSINYIEMIPLLVKSINELSEELEDLKGTSRNRAKAQSETTGIEDSVSDVDMVRMDQNKPNPFSESTVIGLIIPEKTQKAGIFIYDLSGKQIKSIPVSKRGETNITVYASDLSAGMYIYTLVTDGKVSVTRRMIVE